MGEIPSFFIYTQFSHKNPPRKIDFQKNPWYDFDVFYTTPRPCGAKQKECRLQNGLDRDTMANEMLKNAWNMIDSYLEGHYSSGDRERIRGEIRGMANGLADQAGTENKARTYEELQEALSSLNEKEKIRKNKGVYYTPADVVGFILGNSVKMACGLLRPDNLRETGLEEIPYREVCFRKTVYDPTCGSGVFLLAALELKLNLLERCFNQNFNQNLNQNPQGQERPIFPAKPDLQAVVSTIRGNDVNRDSIAITKLRLFLCVLHRYGVEMAEGLGDVLNGCFTDYDYVERSPKAGETYDIIIGNPPYVEDGKSDSRPDKKFGNIYANVLEHAALQLTPGGVMGFVIPLSYVSTPRMKKIREALYGTVPEQYILSYSDRPDCLFTSVHQKLCVLFGRKRPGPREIFTGNYRYWYREERQKLFSTAQAVGNDCVEEGYIPKLGTELDRAIYGKVNGFETPLSKLLEGGGEPLYLNMRAAFWIKAFRREHTGAEYKTFLCRNQNEADYGMCLLNSSLFWWYWICVSDCWHITRKELSGFRVPRISDFSEANRLARALEDRLEETKRYVGTKQTEYEYKHRDCVDVIHQIDGFIHGLYGLTEEEGQYIKNFAYRYRISGGVGDGRN